MPPPRGTAAVVVGLTLRHMPPSTSCSADMTFFSKRKKHIKKKTTHRSSTPTSREGRERQAQRGTPLQTQNVCPPYSSVSPIALANELCLEHCLCPADNFGVRRSLVNAGACIRTLGLEFGLGHVLAAAQQRHFPAWVVELVVMQPADVSRVVWGVRVAVPACACGVCRTREAQKSAAIA